MIAEIALDIEDHFGIRFKGNDLQQIHTVADVIAISERLTRFNDQEDNYS